MSVMPLGGKIGGNAAVLNQQMGEDNLKIGTQNVNVKAKSAGSGELKVKNISPDEIKMTISKINENIGVLNKDVKFAYNDTIKSLVVKVIDAKTGKIIREIPPKEVINLQKKLSEVVGIIFDSKEVK